MESILEDIRVVDLTHVWFGPWTTMMLAEMGAKVIKVEPPWGALGRIEEYGPMYGGAAPSFHHLNLNKKGMVINLKHEEGLKLIKALIEARPELESVVADLMPGATGKPGSQIMKHRMKDEPKTWKELPHVDPRERGGALPQFRIDPRRIKQALIDANEKMDRLIEKWSAL